MKVSDLMTCNVVSIAEDASLDEAMELMDAEGVRHLPVVHGGRLQGVLSERDLLEATGWLPRRVREVLDSPTGQISDFMHAPVVTLSPQDSIVTASIRLLEWNIGCLPVLEDGTLVGMLTDSDVLGAYAAACAGVSISVDSDPPVESVMTVDVTTADHRTPAEDALEFCRSKNVRHLPIQNGDDLVGIISDRDLRRCIGRGQLEGTPLDELGTGELVTIDPEARLSAAARLLVEDHIGAIPVVTGKVLLGLISSSDVLKHCTTAFATTPGTAAP